MKIGGRYSHLNGYEWLQHHHTDIWPEIVDVISSVDITMHRTKISKEKTKLDKEVYNPTTLNAGLSKEFSKRKWEKKVRTNYWLADDYELMQRTMKLPVDDQYKEIIRAGKEPISSFNEIDFVKNRIAVEVQFGKYSFIAYDLFVK